MAMVQRSNVYNMSVSVDGNKSSSTKPIKVTVKCWTRNRLGADVFTNEGTYNYNGLESKCAMIVVMMHIAYWDVKMTNSAGDFVGCYNVN
eukprot:scaffold60711_cov65-Attheya_sp.AAC.14